MGVAVVKSGCDHFVFLYALHAHCYIRIPPLFMNPVSATAVRCVLAKLDLISGLHYF